MSTKYDHWDKHYASGRDFRFSTPKQITRMLSYVTKKPNLEHRILDLGCGTGHLTREFYHRGYDSTGLEISQEAIEIAKSATIFGKNIHYIQADLETDFAERLKGVYSLIVTKYVYAFVNNKTSFLDNVKKSLGQEGVFVVISPLKERFPEIGIDPVETRTTLEKLFTVVDYYEENDDCYFILGTE